MTATTRLWCEYALLPDGLAEHATIDIVDGRIDAIEVGTPRHPDGHRRSGLTIPGAANAHSHAFHRALRHRSQLGRGSFWTWREQMYAIAAALDPDTYHRLARAVFAEMVLAGYTTVGEFHYVHHTPGGRPYADPNAMADALTEAAADTGIRLTLLDTVYLHGGLGGDGYLPLSDRQRRFGDRSIDAWAERVSALPVDERRRVGAAIHSIRAVDPDAIAVVAGWAARRGAPLHAHVSEQPAENEQCLVTHGCTPVELLARHGAFDAAFTAVHATHLTERDITLLGEAGATVGLCPTTERDLGDGVGPARRLADAGVVLAIGSDSHAVIEPLEEARAIELDERLVRGERGCFTAADLFAATTAGHAALGWDDVGAIAVGQRADLVTMALDSPRTAGCSADSLVEAVVFAATSADVTHVMIDGRDIVEFGQHDRIDVAAELAAAIAEVVE